MNDDLTVFISYRRADSSADAGRLYDALRRRFGRENLFMDVDSLRPGEDWVVAVEGAVTSCDVLLAIIGPTWVGAADSDGGLRLQNELDRVRLEIEAALRNNKPVIPVLVEGATMPTAAQLPDSLKPLLRRHAIRISHPTFDSDLGALVRALRTIDRARQPKAVPGAAAVVGTTAAATIVVPPAAPAPAAPAPPPPVPPSEPPTQTYIAPQPPVPPSQPVYPAAPVQPAYPYQAPAYAYTQPAPRSGPSPVALGLLGLVVVVVVGVLLMALLHIGPFAATAVSSPTPVPTTAPSATIAPTPTPTAVPTPTAAPTATAALTPSLAPTPTVAPTPTTVGERTPYPSAAFDAIRAIVPTEFVSSCEPTSNYDTPQLFCFLGNQSFWYAKYPDLASLKAEYDTWRNFYNVEPDVANCFDENQVVPCEWPYAVNDFDPAGRVTGVVDDSNGWVYWTNEPALTLGIGLGTVDADSPFTETFDYWREHAVVLNYYPTPSP